MGLSQGKTVPTARRTAPWPDVRLPATSQPRWPPGWGGGGGRPSRPHLVVDEQLNGVVAPLYQHDLIGLPGHRVRERGADARRGAGPQPQADGEGVQLGQRLLDLAVQVVRAEGEGHFEGIRRLESTVAWGGGERGSSM